MPLSRHFFPLAGLGLMSMSECGLADATTHASSFAFPLFLDEVAPDDGCYDRRVRLKFRGVRRGIFLLSSTGPQLSLTGLYSFPSPASAPTPPYCGPGISLLPIHFLPR